MLEGKIERQETQNKGPKVGNPVAYYAGCLNVRHGCVRDLIHPLNPTTNRVQQKARHVNATARFKNIITSTI